MTRFPDTIIVLDAARTVYVYAAAHHHELSNEIINNITHVYYIHIHVLKCVCFRPFPFTESTTATLSRSRTYIIYILYTPNRNPTEWPQLSVHARIHAAISFFRHNITYSICRPIRYNYV